MQEIQKSTNSNINTNSNKNNDNSNNYNSCSALYSHTICSNIAQ